MEEHALDLGYAVGDMVGAMVQDDEMERIPVARGLSYAPPDTE